METGVRGRDLYNVLRRRSRGKGERTQKRGKESEGREDIIKVVLVDLPPAGPMPCAFTWKHMGITVCI